MDIFPQNNSHSWSLFFLPVGIATKPQQQQEKKNTLKLHDVDFVVDEDELKAKMLHGVCIRMDLKHRQKSKSNTN